MFKPSTALVLGLLSLTPLTHLRDCGGSAGGGILTTDGITVIAGEAKINLPIPGGGSFSGKGIHAVAKEGKPPITYFRMVTWIDTNHNGKIDDGESVLSKYEAGDPNNPTSGTGSVNLDCGDVQVSWGQADPMPSVDYTVYQGSGLTPVHIVRSIGASTPRT